MHQIQPQDFVVSHHFSKLTHFPGGLPNIEFMTGVHNSPTGFIGCIHSLQIQNSGVINFEERALSSVNVLPCER